MKIKTLHLVNYCGYSDVTFDLNRGFTCLYGPNGCGKTTVLTAVSSLCSSMDFTSDAVTEDMRRKKFLEPNIKEGQKGFEVAGIFEHEGQDYEVILTHEGWKKNDILKQSWWWPGLTYFAKFDTETKSFCIHKDIWPRFKEAYEKIMGFEVEPDFYDDVDERTIHKPTAERVIRGTYAINFWLNKSTGRIQQPRASAGEKKVAKSLSQIVNLPQNRLPQIVLVDNLEMHVYSKRHLIMFEVIKDIFKNMQVLATSHSTVIIEQYEPKTDLIDVEALIIKENQNGVQVS